MSESPAESRVKISFRLEKDEDEYPPADWEMLWAKPAGDDLYEIDNIPFFVKGVSLGDRVRAKRDGKDLVFTELAQPAGHTTVRVLLADPDKTLAVREMLGKLGCRTELSHIRGLVSVDVPPRLLYRTVKDFLSRQEATGLLEYEEAALAHEE